MKVKELIEFLQMQNGDKNIECEIDPLSYGHEFDADEIPFFEVTSAESVNPASAVGTVTLNCE